MTSFAQEELAAVDGYRALLAALDCDGREGTMRTPERAVRAMLELGRYTGPDAADLLAVTFPDTEHPVDQMIAVGPVEFTSLCEHHLLPFTGHAWIAYTPGSLVVGLSKLARLVDCYARRPQVQERMTGQITAAIETYLRPGGSGCVIRATHSCLAIRGARKNGATMVTSSLNGSIRHDPAARAEFMALTRGGQ